MIGALLEGTTAVEYAKRDAGITRRTGDLFVLPLMLGIANGRFGCLLAGTQDGRFGVPTSLPWGMDLGDGIRRHPVQLYEIAVMVALAVPLYRIRPPRFEEGDRFRAFTSVPFAMPPAAPRVLNIDLSSRSSACSMPWSISFPSSISPKRAPSSTSWSTPTASGSPAKKGFAERLASYMPGFELYLQFDSFQPAALRELRGADLTSIRTKAIEKLNRLGVSTSLVVTLKRGLNDNEIGRIIDWAIEQPCVRGVVLEPIQAAGRFQNFDPARDRLTLTEVRRKILEQTKIFRPGDIVPVPCHLIRSPWPTPSNSTVE